MLSWRNFHCFCRSVHLAPSVGSVGGISQFSLYKASPNTVHRLRLTVLTPGSVTNRDSNGDTNEDTVNEIHRIKENTRCVNNSVSSL